MLTKINALLSSSDPNNIKLGVTLLESLYPDKYAELAAEWRPWAFLFGTTVADTIARNGLGKIDCSCMKLRAIPALPKTVRVLYCTRNRLTALPAMPNVQVLHCSHNQLSTLPKLPLLHKLVCWNNQLSTLPELPLLHTLYCWDNPFKNPQALLELYPFAQM